jgi:hypothetical protein
VKCIYCATDSKYKERLTGECSQCHKRFAFEPKNGDPFTDPAFKSAIDAVSSQGMVRWGVEHLYYELRRRRTRLRLKKEQLVAGLIGLVVLISWLGGPAAIFDDLPTAALFVVILSVIGGGVWLAARLKGGQTLGPGHDPEFDRLWQRWVAVHGKPPGLIVRKEQPKRAVAPEPDIADYSFDRAVICDRARTVDLLVANNFHFENNCAVLAIGGYPPGPFETIRTMLKRNPKLQVFALHDATVAGCRLAHRLANDSAWFKDQASVTDVGLRPRHAKPYGRLLLSVPSTGVQAGEGIGGDEVPWLSEYALELAVIRPEQVLKRLFRAINRKEKASGDGDGDGSSTTSDHDSSSFSSDAGDSDGAGDAFG